MPFYADFLFPFLLEECELAARSRSRSEKTVDFDRCDFCGVNKKEKRKKTKMVKVTDCLSPCV